MKKVIIIITLVLIFSCNSEKKNKGSLEFEDKESISQIEEKDNQFQKFISQFPVLDLPLKIKACDDNFENLIELDNDLGKEYESQSYYVYGKIESNDNYIVTITLESAECYLPIITTYKVNGEKISTATLAIGLCGPDPCFECEELMEIDSSLNIYVAFISRYYDCDEEGKEIFGTDKKEVIYKKGRITEEGVVELTKEMKK